MFGLGGIAEAFRDANFCRYSIGSIVSWLSYFVQAVAIAWVTWTLTHSTRWLAIIALLDSLPMSLLAPLGGVVADRADRFRMLMISYALATLHAVALTILSATGQLTISWLAALALFHGLVHAFSVPAAFGLLPRFVAAERLAPAIAVAAAYTQLAFFVGPALAGVVLAHFGPTAAFASNVAGYGVFFLSASRMRAPRRNLRRPQQSSFLRDLLEGLKAIRDHEGVRGLLALMLFGDALVAAVRQMAPAFADRNLGVGVGGFSMLLTGAGLGATVAALWLAQGGAKRLQSRILLAAFAGHLAATVVFLCSGTLAFAAVAMAARGFCYEISRTSAVGLLQTSTPDRLRGRIMSAQFLIQQAANVLGVAVIGGVADRFGLAPPLLCAAALAFVAWGFAIRRRRLWDAAFASSAKVDAAAA